MKDADDGSLSIVSTERSDCIALNQLFLHLWFIVKDIIQVEIKFLYLSVGFLEPGFYGSIKNINPVLMGHKSILLFLVRTEVHWNVQLIPR